MWPLEDVPGSVAVAVRCWQRALNPAKDGLGRSLPWVAGTDQAQSKLINTFASVKVFASDARPNHGTNTPGSILLTNCMTQL